MALHKLERLDDALNRLQVYAAQHQSESLIGPHVFT